MAGEVLSSEETTIIAQAIAAEAVVGVLVRDGNVDNERVRAWIGEVVSDEPNPQQMNIIARAMFFAQRMTGGGGKEAIRNFL